MNIGVGIFLLSGVGQKGWGDEDICNTVQKRKKKKKERIKKNLSRSI